MLSTFCALYHTVLIRSVGLDVHTCSRQSQKASPFTLQRVQHPLVTELDLVSQILHEFGDKINVGIHRLFECAPFSSCFDNLFYFIFLLFSTHTTHVVIVFNVFSLGSALINVALLLYHLQGLMPLRWCRPVAPDFEEKDGWDTFNLLDEEAACGESKTGT